MAQAQMQGARALEGTSRGGLEGRNEQNEHEASIPPHFFYKTVRATEKSLEVQGPPDA